MEQNKILSIINTMTAVMIIGNPNLEGKPLVTPLIDKEGNPRADLLGNPIGSIRLEQHSRSLNGSYMNSRKRVAFLSGTYDELVDLVKENKLTEGATIPGKITVTESLEPFWKGQNPKMNPSTEETIGVRIGDVLHPVYMTMQFTEDLNKKDKFIRTAEDVNAWVSERKMVEDMTTNTHVETAGIPAAPNVPVA